MSLLKRILLALAAFGLLLGTVSAFGAVTPAGAAVGDPTPARRPEHLMSAGYSVWLAHPDAAASPYWMDLPQYRVDGELTWGFCVDAENRYENGSGTIVSSIATTPPAVLAKVRAVLAQLDLRDPADTVTTPYIGWPVPGPDPTGYGRTPQRVQDRLDAIAGQLAIWHFTDNLVIAGGASFAEDGLAPGAQLSQWDNSHVTQAMIEARLAELIAGADAAPAGAVAPTPAVSVTPSTTTATTGSNIVMNVTGTNTDTIALSATNGANVHPAAGGNCDTSKTIDHLDGTGGQICIEITTSGQTIVSAGGSAVWVQGDIISFSSDQARMVALKKTISGGAANASATINATVPTTSTSTTTPAVPVEVRPNVATPTTATEATPTTVIASAVAGLQESRTQGGSNSTPRQLAFTGGSSLILSLVGLGSIALGLVTRRASRSN